MFTNLKVGMKLALGFGVIIALMIGLVGNSLFTILERRWVK